LLPTVFALPLDTIYTNPERRQRVVGLELEDGVPKGTWTFVDAGNQGKSALAA
jgi:hypothetical protein